MNREELRKYIVKDKNLNGLTFDKYVEKVENMTRSVIEERPTNFREIDVFSRLIMDRIIFLGMEIEENIANIINKNNIPLNILSSGNDITGFVTDSIYTYSITQKIHDYFFAPNFKSKKIIEKKEDKNLVSKKKIFII